MKQLRKGDRVIDHLDGAIRIVDHQVGGIVYFADGGISVGIALCARAFAEGVPIIRTPQEQMRWLDTQSQYASQIEAEAQAEGREDCPVRASHCMFYGYQCDNNGEVAIDYCAHPKNPTETEGNATPTLCPFKQLPTVPSADYEKALDLLGCKVRIRGGYALTGWVEGVEVNCIDSHVRIRIRVLECHIRPGEVDVAVYPERVYPLASTNMEVIEDDVPTDRP